MIKIQPRHDNIYVQFEKPLEKVKKLYVPEEHRERTRVGTIMVIGEKVTSFKPGERIIASYFAGVPLELPQYDLDPVIDRIMRESEILATIGEAEGEE